MPATAREAGFIQRLFRSLGPAIIVACVVLGPGSILTSSKVGCQFGYHLAWMVIAAGVLMIGAVATSARVGVGLAKSPCSELADRLGRPVALLAGLAVFLIASCFQFSNNLGVLASVEPLVGISASGRLLLLLLLNLGLAACLFGLPRLYAPVEKLMMVLVGLMILGFAANLVMAWPSLSGLLAGMMPSIPDELYVNFLPRVETLSDENPAATRIIDPWLAVQGLVATTFSIAGAFYQAYLVKEKGWTEENLRQGLVDSIVGTLVLVGITMMIMVTSAAVLSGSVSPGELRSAADVARQLEPLFGPAAKLLFCVGIFAGALSSFLVNSMIGGTLLADGLGLDSRMDSPWTKRFTVLVMLIGMVVALATSPAGRVPLIIFAQAITVLGGPILALSLIYLAVQTNSTGRRIGSTWMIVLSAAGTFVVLALAVRTGVRIWLQL